MAQINKQNITLHIELNVCGMWVCGSSSYYYRWLVLKTPNRILKVVHSMQMYKWQPEKIKLNKRDDINIVFLRNIPIVFLSRMTFTGWAYAWFWGNRVDFQYVENGANVVIWRHITPAHRSFHVRSITDTINADYYFRFRLNTCCVWEI